jgi:hypothetical protein
MADIKHFAAPPGIKAPPLSFAARTGDLLFISGIPGFDANGNLPDGFEAQFANVVTSIKRILDATPSGVKNNADLTYDFITWYYSEEGAMGILAKTYAIVPPVESLYESPTWRNLPGPPSNTSVFADSIKFGAINPNPIPHAVQSIINKELRDAEDSVVLNGADPVQRLHLIELFKRLGADGRTVIVSSLTDRRASVRGEALAVAIGSCG